jgi:hypothetical protein
MHVTPKSYKLSYPCYPTHRFIAFPVADALPAAHPTVSCNYLFVLASVTTPWSPVLPKKLRALQMGNKFPAFYETRRFLTAFTTACHLCPSWPRSIKPIPPSHFLKIHFNIILTPRPRYSNWCPSLRSHHTKTLYARLLSPICATCPSHLICLSLLLYRVFILSFPRARELYRTESLHPPTHPVTVAVLWEIIKDAPFTILSF